ncbi:MAG: 2,3-bisphosphoglycerate-independent phosphoglycerate mutase [Patescibacteria group bacterium]
MKNSLKSAKTSRPPQSPVMLIVLDGWGYREDLKDNAIAAAKKPFFDSLWAKYPHSLLKASGNAVGLPEGQMGNSEVCHMTIGAGRPADTDLVRIDKSIEDESFASITAFQELFDHVRKYNSILHVQGLVSPGGVHSHQNHLFAFLRLAKKAGMKKVAIHVFTDGRDTPPQSGATYLKGLEALIAELGPNFFIASISGRFYAMDRDNNWDRLAKTESALFECKGNLCEIRPSEYLEGQYKSGKNDELLEPVVCTTLHGTGCAISKNDAVLFFNFRSDRAKMLTNKILLKQDSDNIKFVTLTEYSNDSAAIVAFPPSRFETTLGREISLAGLLQARITETEKFPHATYFLNGGQEKAHEGENDIMLPSRKDIKTHDEAPEMRAEGIADAALEEIKKGTDFIFINFANPDMVGHTANVPAIIKAIETVDTQLKRVIETLEQKGGVAVIIADHGNAEVNIDPVTGTKHTAHTTNLVPCIITNTERSVRNGELPDVAPTILTLLGLKIPKGMTGTSLITSVK